MIDEKRTKEFVARREALGMTRTELASALKTTLPTVTRWERNQRAIPTHMDMLLDAVEFAAEIDRAKRSKARRVKSDKDEIH
jgi:DNA-binding transcriptional regulator YiaG